MKYCNKCRITHEGNSCPLCTAKSTIEILRKKITNKENNITDLLIRKLRMNPYNRNTISADQINAHVIQNKYMR
jgi:hypothetical protein